MRYFFYDYLRMNKSVITVRIAFRSEIVCPLFDLEGSGARGWCVEEQTSRRLGIPRVFVIPARLAGITSVAKRVVTLRQFPFATSDENVIKHLRPEIPNRESTREERR